MKLSGSSLTLGGLDPDGFFLYMTRPWDVRVLDSTGPPPIKLSSTGYRVLRSPDMLCMKRFTGLQLETPVESKTRTYHGRVGTGRRTAGRRGGAGPGRTGRRQIGSPRIQPSPLPSKASNTPVLNVSSGSRTSEMLCKPVGEQSPRWTRVGSAVYQRDEKRSSFLAADQWTVAFLSL